MSLPRITKTIVTSAFVLAFAVCSLQAQTTIYSFIVPTAGGYDAAGNLLSYADNINGAWGLNYDSLNRLTAASSTAGLFNGITLLESYDSFGNRWVQSSTTATGASPSVMVPSRWAHFNLPNNQLTSADTAIGGVSYDSAGNLTFDGQNQNVFDGDGRLCASRSSVSGSGITQYIYNAEGQRTAKLTGASTLACYTRSSTDGTPAATYLLGAAGEQVTEIDGSGTWKHTNVFSNGEVVASYDSTGVHFPIHDALGSLRAEVSGTGVVEETCANLPFGDVQSCSQAITEPNELHFTGKERDAESGLDYFGARYYGSNMGRFMSPDWSKSPEAVPYASLKDPQSLNLYSYVLNNPLSHHDPDGHSCASDTVSTGRDGSVTVTAGACTPDWWQFQGVRRWVGNHPKTVKAGFGVVNAATVVSGLLDGGASEFAVPEELIAEEAILEAGEIAAEEAAEAGAEKAGEVASEKTAKYFAKRVEKELGKDARREFHDEKMGGGGDRTLQQLKDDARAIFEDHGKTPPSWTK